MTAPRPPARPRPGTVSGKTMALVVVGGLVAVFVTLALVAIFMPREDGAREPGHAPPQVG